MQLMSEAQDSATIIDQQIMTEEGYQILAKSEKMQSQIIEAIKFYEKRVHLTCTVGDDIFLYERVIPVTEYPIVPVPNPRYELSVKLSIFLSLENTAYILIAF